MQTQERPNTELDQARQAAPPSEDGGLRFLFGVATSDHQSEAYDPRYPDIWDVWEDRMGMTLRGRGTDFWNRYEEDIELARGMGCRAFRFSISWARVEPRPGEWNQEALEHYAEVVRAIRRAGMEPVVTLLHWVWPVHVEERGGLMAAEFPQWFRAYAAEVARWAGEGVRYWISINEPNAIPFGYIRFWWQRDYPMPPGLGRATAEQQVEATARVIRNLFRAHTAAREAVRLCHPEARVSANPCLLGLPGWFQEWLDWRTIRSGTEEQWLQRERRSADAGPLDRTDADLVLAFLSSTERGASGVLFSEPYFRGRNAFLVLAEGPIQACGDLVSHHVGVLRGSAADGELCELLPSAHRHRFRDFPAALEALDRGLVAAVLENEAQLQVLAGEAGGKYRVVAAPVEPHGYAAAVPQGGRDLLELIDDTLRELRRSGAWEASFRRHFPGVPLPELPRGRRAPSEASPDTGESAQLQAIRRRGKLRVAVNADAPGLCYLSDSGQELLGLEIDLARALARRIFGDESKLELHLVRRQRRISAVRSMFRGARDFFRKIRSLGTIANTNWWHLGMAGKLPSFLCPPECVGQQDFVGLDYYWGINAMRLDRVLELLGAMQQQFARAPVWSKGLYRALRTLQKQFPGQDILIAENGCPEREDGIDRLTYIQRHVGEVIRACRHGVPVVGYLCWSITTCREWGLPDQPGCDFGLYHVDLENDPELRREPTDASRGFRELIESMVRTRR